MPQTLNSRQTLAMETTEGKVRVVAGAGSGKTRVLAHRYAYLVNEIGVNPGNILCLTFTNKASKEMKSRIAKMVDRGAVNDFICTIHSFCAKFLRREIYRIGYPKNFMILDEEDARSLAKQAMTEFGIDRKKNTAERFLKGVSAYKGMSIDAYIQNHILPAASDTGSDATLRYIRLQVKQYLLDYDDLLYFTIYILNHFPDAREYWTDLLNYIMVDEVQDCSSDDWKLLNILCERYGNLFVVGDPDQAIYEWRGANPSLFVRFHAQTDIILNENYRSTPDILDVANSIISNNVNRVPKELFTVRLNERQAVYRHCKSEKEEAERIASTIQEELKRGVPYSSFAVLYRSSFISRQLEQTFVKMQIPYTIWGGVKFFERKEIKDVVSYLRLVASDNDDLAFERIINLPSRKFGAVSLKKLKELAETENIPLMQALRENISLFPRPALRKFIDLIDETRSLSASLPVSELTDRLLQSSGLGDLYRNDEEEERLENINELINSMKEFELTRIDESDATIADYLREIALYTSNEHEHDSDRVRMMTIHQSKGLEFPTVFVAGLTEGVFPSHRSIRERRKNGEEEERRLMYVAVTRAEKMLYLSESEGYANENGALKYPSRFITEIPDVYLSIEGDPDPSLFEGTRGMVDQLNAELSLGTESPFKEGDDVVHKVFGKGTVLKFDPSANSYKVRFPIGERMIVARAIRKP